MIKKSNLVDSLRQANLKNKTIRNKYDNLDEILKIKQSISRKKN